MLNEEDSVRTFYNSGLNQPKYVLPFVRRLVPNDKRPSQNSALSYFSKNSRSRQYAPYKLQKNNCYENAKHNTSMGSSTSQSKEDLLARKYSTNRGQVAESPIARPVNRTIRRNASNLHRINR